MRITVQITEEQRARLLEIAATRGHKGCSKVVQEAVTFYLDEQAREQARKQALAAAAEAEAEIQDRPRGERLRSPLHLWRWLRTRSLPRDPALTLVDGALRLVRARLRRQAPHAA